MTGAGSPQLGLARLFAQQERACSRQCSPGHACSAPGWAGRLGSLPCSLNTLGSKAPCSRDLGSQSPLHALRGACSWPARPWGRFQFLLLQQSRKRSLLQPGAKPGSLPSSHLAPRHRPATAQRPVNPPGAATPRSAPAPPSCLARGRTHLCTDPSQAPPSRRGGPALPAKPSRATGIQLLAAQSQDGATPTPGIQPAGRAPAASRESRL